MKNKVELLGHYGSDEIIACSAWTSTSRKLTAEKRERISDLIKNLWNAGHETPFEKGTVHFLVDTDIASHIHLLKHRLSSMNGESARYKELKEDKFYIPEDWEEIENTAEIVMDGSVIAIDSEKWVDILENFSQASNELYHQCILDLTPSLGRKRAKESARFFKLYNSQIEADISFNMRSFANFIRLRDSEHAQLEIREIAQKMWELVSQIEGNPFKSTLEAIQNKIKKLNEHF